MSYLQVRGDLVSLLAGVANFDTNTVAAADFKVLNTGPERAMVVNYLGVDVEPEIFSHNLRVWRFGITLFEKLSPDEASVETKAAADREAILNRVMNYPKLNASHVRDARVVSGRDLGDQVEVGGISYFREEFEVVAEEDVEINALE